MSLIEDLRKSRKNPSVLKMKALKVDGEHPGVLIFFFEGPDDIPVYEEWLARIQGCPAYEPVAGAGKQQLLAYHEQLRTSNEPLLRKSYFFVDRDFDPPAEESKNLFELPAYSIENLICNEAVVESMLKDEFRRSGSVAERAKISAAFRQVRHSFYQCCLPINFLLFVAQRATLPVRRKPEKISEIAQIDVDSLVPAFKSVDEIVEIENLPSAEELKTYEAQFDQLSCEFRERGKYILDMFRRWLKALMEDVKGAQPKLFEKSDDRVPGDPSSVSIRRFANSTPPPQKLVEFVASIIGQGQPTAGVPGAA